MQIKMAYLDREYASVKTEIDRAISATIASSQFIGGHAVKQVEKELSEYLQVRHVISCGNGTDALLISLMALNLNDGDEVIMPAFGYFSSYEMCCLLRLKPVLIDIDPRTFNIDHRLIEASINDKTRVIIPQHLFGMSCDMESILDLSIKYNLAIIEDSAQSIGAKVKVHNSWLNTGTVGTMGCFSFFPTKNLGCYGDGGAVCTNDDALAKILREIATHGQSIKYRHERIGLNSRLDALQAKILSAKLSYLNGWTERRRAIAKSYDVALANHKEFSLPFIEDYADHCYHQYTLTIAQHKRDILQKHLLSKGIETIVYYPTPLHMQPAYKNASYEIFAHSELCSQSVLSIPISPFLKEEETNYIMAQLNLFQF